MASNAFLIVLLIVATAIAPALAAEYVVGDSNGWTLDVNYTSWAEGKDFYVGDSLVFTYNKDYHNVAKVNGSAFQQCSAPDSNSTLNTGNDIITFSTPGKKWYICSVQDHCSKGMKLVINVNSAVEGPAPAPMPKVLSPAPCSPGTSGVVKSLHGSLLHRWLRIDDHGLSNSQNSFKIPKCL